MAAGIAVLRAPSQIVFGVLVRLDLDAINFDDNRSFLVFSLAPPIKPDFNHVGNNPKKRTGLKVSHLF